MSANTWALKEIEEEENELWDVERRCQSNAAVLATGSVEERKAQWQEEEERQQAFESLRTFEREDYRAGFWVRHRHVNTIAGPVLAVAPPDPAYRRVRWDTPDGDFLDLDLLDSSTSFSRGVVIVCHGVESSSSSTVVRRSAIAAVQGGFDVVALNCRTCSGEDSRTHLGYWAGGTGDLRFVIERIHKEDPERKIFLTGASMGGNHCAKLLGELGAGARALGIQGAAVACVPFHVHSTMVRMDDRGVRRTLIGSRVLTSMMKKAETKHEKFPGTVDIARVRSCKTLVNFSEAFVAPNSGVSNVDQFWSESSAGNYLRQVCVPLFVMQALDDPILCPPSWVDEDDIGDGTIRVDFTSDGGHHGYLRSWSQDCKVKWGKLLLATLRGKPREGVFHSPPGYLPTQMIRFLQHLDERSGGHPAPPPAPSHLRRNKGCLAGALRSDLRAVFRSKPSGWAPADFSIKEHDHFLGHLKPKDHLTLNLEEHLTQNPDGHPTQNSEEDPAGFPHKTPLAPPSMLLWGADAPVGADGRESWGKRWAERRRLTADANGSMHAPRNGSKDLPLEPLARANFESHIARSVLDVASPVRLSSPSALTNLRRARSSSKLSALTAGNGSKGPLEARDLLRAPSVAYFRKLGSNGSKGLGSNGSKARASPARVWPEPLSGGAP